MVRTCVHHNFILNNFMHICSNLGLVCWQRNSWRCYGWCVDWRRPSWMPTWESIKCSIRWECWRPFSSIFFHRRCLANCWRCVKKKTTINGVDLPCLSAWFAWKTINYLWCMLVLVPLWVCRNHSPAQKEKLVLSIMQQVKLNTLVTCYYILVCVIVCVYHILLSLKSTNM